MELEFEPKLCPRCGYNLAGIVDATNTCPECAGEIPAPMRPTDEIGTPIRCIGCGYNLMGLMKTGHCPECGTPAVNSMRGTFIGFSSSEYLRRLHLGARIIRPVIMIQAAGQLLAIVSSLVAGVAVSLMRGGVDVSSELKLFQYGKGFLLTAIAFLLLYGWWLFSTPDPAYAGIDRGDRIRRFVRIMLIISAIATALFAPFGAYIENQSTAGTAPLRLAIAGLGMGIVGGIIGLTQFIASMLYVRWLAARIPSKPIAERAKTLTWLGPILFTVGILLVGLGPIIALILYWDLMGKIKRELTRVVEAKAAEA